MDRVRSFKVETTEKRITDPAALQTHHMKKIKSSATTATNSRWLVTNQAQSACRSPSTLVHTGDSCGNQSRTAVPTTGAKQRLIQTGLTQQTDRPAQQVNPVRIQICK